MNGVAAGAASLESRWAAIAARLRPLIARLPVQPPAHALALALDRLLLPRLEPDVRACLSGHCVAVVLTDLGLTMRLQLGGSGFALAPREAAPALTIAAALPIYLRLLRGQDDADRLFFERSLVMEGDTELGLVLKNTLDALGPLFG